MATETLNTGMTGRYSFTLQGVFSTLRRLSSLLRNSSQSAVRIPFQDVTGGVGLHFIRLTVKLHLNDPLAKQKSICGLVMAVI